ncbi:MAG: site-2 protease family protein [Bacteroides sp.]|nr:site-2 protease family protein [Bacteroides sp.]
MLDLITQSASSALMVVQIFVCFVIIFAVIPLHECAHAWTAKALGDPTPDKSGRLSLNPLLHIDIMGTFAVLLFGFGWGRPIPVNPYRCTRTKPRAATALIALAGPFANILIAYIAMIAEKIILYSNMEIILSGKESPEYYLYYAAAQVVSTSIYLAVFNLLPVPPFDGARFFMIFLPTKLYIRIMKYERAIMTVIMLLFLFGVFNLPMAFLSSSISQGLFYATGYVEFFMGI